ncbi:hypothetical protein CRUP_003783, partial [Coryphaenoides rupestris]
SEEDFVRQCRSREKELEGVACLYASVEPEVWAGPDDLVRVVKERIAEEQKKMIWVEQDLLFKKSRGLTFVSLPLRCTRCMASVVVVLLAAAGAAAAGGGGGGGEAVACTNWKKIMIILSESMLQDGAPYTDPQAIPRNMVHNSSSHLTFNKFWHRYGKFSHHLMKLSSIKDTGVHGDASGAVREVEARRHLYKLYEPDFRLFGYERPDSVLEE